MPSKHSAESHPNRCQHIKRDKTRCKRFAQAGLKFCATPGHGGTGPNNKAKAARAREEAKTNAYLVRKGYGAGEVDEDHPGANPVSGLLWELRRTAFNIEFLQDKVAEIKDDSALIFGRTVEETKRAEVNVGPGGQVSDGSYELERDEARVNLWVGLLAKERVHYANLCKIAISAGLEAKRIAMQEQQILLINEVISNILTRFGKDPNSAENRKIVRDEFALLEG